MPAARKHLSAADRALWEPALGLVFPRKPMLRPDEIAAALGVDLRTVARLFEVDGRDLAKRPWLMGIEFNAGEGERMSRRVPRDAAILFWAASANYTPAELLSLLLDVLEARTDAELLAVIERAQAILRRRA